MGRIFQFIVVFLFIFGSQVNRIGAWADIIFFTSLFIIFFNIKDVSFWDSKFFLVFLLLVFLNSLLVIRSLFYEEVSFSIIIDVILKPLRILITLLGGFYLAKNIFTKSISMTAFEQQVVGLTFFAISFHAFIMILQFLSPSFKDQVYSIITSGEFRSSFEYDFRMGGLSGSTGGAVLSVVQSIGVLLFPFQIKNSRNILSKIFVIICTFSILFSIIICGRSGIWAILLFMPLALLMIDNYNFSKWFKKIAFSFGVLVVVFMSISLNQIVTNDSELFNSFTRTFDTFTQLQESGDFEDETINELFNHLILPSDISIWVFGDNDAYFNTQFDRNLDSDIGYIRNLWSFGILGTLIFIFPVVYVLIVLSLSKSLSLSFAKLVILVAAIMMFFHSKEMFLYTRMLMSIFSLFLGAFIVSERKITI